MELDDALVKAELDDIMARINGIMKNVEKFEGYDYFEVKAENY